MIVFVERMFSTQFLVNVIRSRGFFLRLQNPYRTTPENSQGMISVMLTKMLSEVAMWYLQNKIVQKSVGFQNDQRRRDDKKNKSFAFEGGGGGLGGREENRQVLLLRGGGPGGQRGKSSKNAAFFARGKRHDNKNLKVQIVLSRDFVAIAQAPKRNLVRKMPRNAPQTF